MTRLRALELQCRSFPGGVVAAAVWVPLVQPPAGDANRTQHNQAELMHAIQSVEGLFRKVEAMNARAAANASTNSSRAFMGPTPGFRACSLRLLLFSELLGEAALTVLMPLNALRNAAMLAADTPVAAMVDVDLCMSRGLMEHLMANKTRVDEVVRRAEQERILWVMPAWDTNRTLGYHGRNALLDEIIAMKPGEKSTRLKEAWQVRHDVFPFAFDRFVAGHNATDFPRWLYAAAEYPVVYSSGYEPWFIAARQVDGGIALVVQLSVLEPDTGYYYNRLLSVRYMALQQRNSFWVLPDVWLVHRHHDVVVSSKPMFPNGTTFRDVFNERGKDIYLEAIAQIDEGTYTPRSDVASQYCRQVLPWWK
ncbi:hypothetical protein PLESTF_000437700 [Pleodorina starrii]|nr:hypothetical protein PLESTM_000067000 [Pleodorina starrii]GLC66504.1 hypothetical protein PLESTF_000437700 [Pleodorina starrii]